MTVASASTLASYGLARGARGGKRRALRSSLSRRRGEDRVDVKGAPLRRAHIAHVLPARQPHGDHVGARRLSPRRIGVDTGEAPSAERAAYPSRDRRVLRRRAGARVGQDHAPAGRTRAVTPGSVREVAPSGQRGAQVARVEVGRAPSRRVLGERGIAVQVDGEGVERQQPGGPSIRPHERSERPGRARQLVRMRRRPRLHHAGRELVPRAPTLAPVARRAHAAIPASERQRSHGASPISTR